MTAKLSTHAQRALERLTKSWMLNWSIQTDAQRNDDYCPGTDAPNRGFNTIREYYLGSLQVGHAADTLNSYSQSILAEIIVLDAGVWAAFGPLLDKKGGLTREKAVELLRIHRGPDYKIRDFFRDEVKCFWSAESEIVSKLRNKFVHQNGHDPNREVEKLIAEKAGLWSVLTFEVQPGVIPVRYLDAEWLDADAELGKWACVHVRDHISAMDQNLCSRFPVPRDRWRPRPISRQLGSLPNPRQRISRTSLPVIPTNSPAPNFSPTIAPIAAPQPMNISPEEIRCAHAWRALAKDISAFIENYLKEAGVRMTGKHAGCPGTVHGHTIRGHEQSLEYTLVPEDSTDSHSRKMVCVRIRQKDFKSFITLWGTDSLMQDFSAAEINDEIREYLRDLVDRVVTR